MDLFDYISRVPSPLINKIISTYFSDVRIGGSGEVCGGGWMYTFPLLADFFFSICHHSVWLFHRLL